MGKERLFPEVIKDIHTHRQAPQEGRIVNIDPVEGDVELIEGQYYSVGIHPWNASRASERDLKNVETLSRRTEILAIGEAGFDSMRDVAIERQREIFDRQAQIAEAVGKPMILHVVKRWDELFAAKRRLNPKSQWIIHGFRGNGTLAKQLVEAGFYISIGKRYNPEILEVIEPEKLFRESDTE